MTMISLAEIRGRSRCVDMLLALQTWWSELNLDVKDDDIQAALLAHEPEILRKYLDEARKAGPEAERGFLCALSDYLGGSLADLPAECLHNRYRANLKTFAGAVEGGNNG